ncbi:MAG TPA: RNA methyltransferase [Polyangiaceae bacterium]|nr:RNA methyltransferase [Polyangiaceae bacterium]
MTWSRDTRLFITAPAGTEIALKAELRDLGLSGAKAARGGVRVRGGIRAITRLCFRSRIAVRVLIEIAQFQCGEERELDAGIADIPWERWLTPDRTLAVRSTSKKSRLTHTGFLAQRTKDAVVDRQRRHFGQRSSVERRDPDLGVVLRLDQNRATVLLDASGASLHRRGWRTEEGQAPLKENLAAALLRLSGWDRKRPLIDPLCGAGTIPIEAELWARGVPAQAYTRRFGFERWASHDDKAREEADAERRAGEARTLDRGPACRGSDHDPELIGAARANATRAGANVRFSVADLAEVEPREPSHIIANPPYGERLDDEGVWEALEAAVLRWRRQHHVSLFLPEDAPHIAATGKSPLVHPLFNGPIRCQLVTWNR